MTFWIIRHGKHGEREQRALEQDVVLIGWNRLPDLSNIENQSQLRSILEDTYPDRGAGTISNWFGQLRSFLFRMDIGDLIGIPLRTQSGVAVGEIKSDYKYFPDNSEDSRHGREVTWLDKGLPKTTLPSDILQSLSSHLTIFKIRRPRPEARIRSLVAGEETEDIELEEEEAEEAGESIDVEEYALNAIVQHIGENFRGHRLTELIGGILTAKGYVTDMSLGGPDQGVDIWAGKGPMGFESPRLAVQVKSSNRRVGSPAIRNLRGAIDRSSAELGLFVSWGGFKNTVFQEQQGEFFRIRLWDADDVVRELRTTYDALPEDLKADIPLKRIWTLVQDE